MNNWKYEDKSHQPLVA